MSTTFYNETPGIKHAFFVILIYALISVIITPLITLIFNVFPDYIAWRTFIAFVLSFGLLLPVAMTIFRSFKIDIEYFPLWQYIILLPGILSLAVISEGIVSLIPMPDMVVEFFAKMIKFNLPDYLSIALAAPILEELVFRGIILKGLLKKYDARKAILWSAAIFGIAHLNPWQFLAAFSAGIAIGWLFWKSKSIWPGIFIHFINNSFSFYLGYRANDINISFAEFVGGTMNYIVLLFVSSVVLFFSAKYFINYYKKKEIKSSY